jgi:DNA (cytosine-5)-methyltransferase 1
MTNKIKHNLKYVDFCSGIGGGKIACDKAGMKSVGFSEISEASVKTYNLFFGEEKNYGDLMKIKESDLPSFDFMIAGFPCQTFSIVGQRGGLKDDRGQIIFGLSKIMRDKNLKYFILENVKGLVHHDKGNSLKVILNELEEAGYYVDYSILSSINYGVPQMRERIYFIGIRKDLIPNNYKFIFPKKSKAAKLENFLIEESENYIFNKNSPNFKTFIKYLGNKYNKNKYSLDDIMKDDYTVLDTRQSDLRIYKDRVPTLRTGRHGIYYVKNGELRKLSGFEALLLQGFPLKFAKRARGRISDAALLSQAGNAMTVNVIEALTKELLKAIK